MKDLLRLLVVIALLAVLVAPMGAQPLSGSINSIGGFENNLPSYWMKGNNPSTLSWATDQSVSLGRSLKITKTTT
ncbi:MAG TPA: hypothetical protein VI704_07705, partial [Bacteroidota bacterium]|nr:hypothetical protein [Bacteroidota bacterium]